MNNVTNIFCSQVLDVCRFLWINNFDFWFFFMLRLYSFAILVFFSLKFFQVNAFQVFNTVPRPLWVWPINFISIIFGNSNFFNFLFNLNNLSLFNLLSHWVFNLRYTVTYCGLFLIHFGEFHFVDNYYIFRVLIWLTVQKYSYFYKQFKAIKINKTLSKLES